MELFEITSVASERLANEIATNINGIFTLRDGRYIISGDHNAHSEYQIHYGWRDRMTYNVMHLSKK